MARRSQSLWHRAVGSEDVQPTRRAHRVRSPGPPLDSQQRNEPADSQAVVKRLDDSVQHRVRGRRPATAQSRLDDGADADWYVFDLLFRTSDKVGTGPQARSLAIWTAREAKRVQNESDGEEAENESA